MLFSVFYPPLRFRQQLVFDDQQLVFDNVAGNLIRLQTSLRERRRGKRSLKTEPVQRTRRRNAPNGKQEKIG
jgi:hypothetical protein